VMDGAGTWLWCVVAEAVFDMTPVSAIVSYVRISAGALVVPSRYIRSR